ncbi:glycosyltransferase involved in cell wall biosynthesis [Hephaestia caeni]|uniref:Glycosyltransferase involved in cell wall biosynthesis n=1 Tax=Hephaestia caeni TaxID=645617 RepID=A0A397PIT2_9SPHN|nr:glycosyltransferase family 1 protein [Hephaestia caeni]RIA45571.1 glycosyltransferase involved in cell wall biosynthesis [Hephaestia caeni]
MKILIVTDAWLPQVNGVVRTLQALRGVLETRGHEVLVVSPDRFRSLPCPSYPEIRLGLASASVVGRLISSFDPDAIHIATEGPLGVAARAWCLRRGLSFTTAYHTQFPEYLAKRTKLPPELFWKYIHWFHRPSRAVLTATPSVAELLRAHGLYRTRLWGRGVDLDCFHPDAPPCAAFEAAARPIQLYVGRVSVEKNIEAFLESGHPGSKIVVGDGPARDLLMRRYPEVGFPGALHGPALAAAYAGADVLVFPSMTDTYGLVMIEALACGTPVAAYPVIGPRDILTDDVGATDRDLARATALALGKDRRSCAAYGRTFSWQRSADQFEHALVSVRSGDEAGQGAVAA